MTNPATVSLAHLRTYIVSLPRRMDRRRQLRRRLPSELAASWTSDWAGPFDGDDLAAGTLHNLGVRLFPWELPDSPNPWWSRPLRTGEVGCTLAHIACWQHAQRTGTDYALILEDDAVLPSAFTATLLRLLTAFRGTNADLLYLGRVPQQPDRGRHGVFVVPGYSHCTYAYVLTRRGLRTVLATNPREAIIPADELLPALYIDHPRFDVRRRYPRRLRALAVSPDLVHQRDKRDAGSDTEHSAPILS